jgi:hypothetical protein
MSQPKIKEFIKTHIISSLQFNEGVKKLLFMTALEMSIDSQKNISKNFLNKERHSVIVITFMLPKVILIDGGHCTSTYTAYSSLFTPTNSDPLRPCKADCLRADLISRPDTE